MYVQTKPPRSKGLQARPQPLTHVSASQALVSQSVQSCCLVSKVTCVSNRPGSNIKKRVSSGVVLSPQLQGFKPLRFEKKSRQLMPRQLMPGNN